MRTRSLSEPGLREEWAELWERSGATPFQSPAWLEPWYRHLCGGEAWMVEARCGGELAALAPCFLYPAPGLGRCLSLAGAGISDYLDILADPRHPEAARAILEQLTAERAQWDWCDFPDLRPDSLLLGTPVPAGLRAEIRESSVCPVLRLPAPVRKPRRTAGLQFEAATAETFEELMTALFRLHAARWALKGQAGVLDGARLRAFHREAGRALFEAGCLRLYGLRKDGVPAAVLYGFARAGRFYGYLTGFDPALARLSPGIVLLRHVIEQCEAEGLREFDFLRGREPYKYRWPAVDQSTRRLVIGRAE